MTVEALLDQILIPRVNGSEGLARVGDFIAQTAVSTGAKLSTHEFVGTPWGFQLVWTVALIVMLGYFASIATRRYGAALVAITLCATLLLLEFELLYSPISGLASLEQQNIVAGFPGEPGGPRLIFAAHYDTTTHFGDHFSWARWGFRQGPATAVGIALAVFGLWRKRAGKDLPRAVTLPIAAAVIVPFAAMFWFQSLGPLLRTPSPGALDNGGSVAALLLLSEQLGSRPAAGATRVDLVFLAAEEERALGSWAFAREMDPEAAVAVINLESVGASEGLATIVEDGFVLTRYRSPAGLVRLIDDVATALWGEPLPVRALPPGTLTDGRSFLAHGIPAITLRAFIDGEFPRGLHSEHDSRDRLSVTGIERGAQLLGAIVDAVDRDPSLLATLGEPTAP